MKSQALGTLPLLLVSLKVSAVWASGLSKSQTDLVETNLQKNANNSWEIGTRAQALLELNHPSSSVFSSSSLPPHKPPSASSINDISIANSVVSSRPAGPGPLVANDASAADPASIGPAVLLANWSQPNSGQNYSYAASAQLNYLLTSVPRAPNGAISHMVAQVALWSDFMYMVPPFLAYYGALSGNASLLQDAYNQCSLYRSSLMNASAGGLWQHIAMGSSPDPGYWATGNGWAAMGMLRVYATMKHSSLSSQFTSQQADLESWVSEIHDGAFPRLTSSDLFPNYILSSSFQDASSSALLAASVFRLSLLSSNPSRYISSATNVYNTLTNGSHINSNGWLTPVVNPYSIGQSGQQSPEGQAFMLMLQAAHQDWTNKNGVSRLMSNGWGLVVVTALTVVLLI